jgi:hypothetical protein
LPLIEEISAAAAASEGDRKVKGIRLVPIAQLEDLVALFATPSVE